MTMTWILVAGMAICLVVVLAVALKPLRSRQQDASARSGLTGQVVRAIAVIAATAILGVATVTVAQRVVDAQAEQARRERQATAALERTRQQHAARQYRLAALERLLPQLSKSEAERDAAILGVRAAGDTEFAVNLARMFPSTGSLAALESIAAQDSSDDRAAAVTALASMNTDPANAALLRLFDDAQKSLIAIDCTAAPDSAVVAAVTWGDRTVLAPLGGCSDPHPRGARRFAERGRRAGDEGLARITFEGHDSMAAPVLEFSSAAAELGERVLAVGIDGAGRPAIPRLGTITAARSDGLFVRFPIDPGQIAGSLVVDPSGTVLGVLAKRERQGGSYRYIRADDIRAWYAQLEREDQVRQRER